MKASIEQTTINHPKMGKVILRRSARRRTLSVEISRGGELIVRGPAFLSKEQILDFALEKLPWIEAHKKAHASREEGQKRRVTEELIAFCGAALPEEEAAVLRGDSGIKEDESPEFLRARRRVEDILKAKTRSFLEKQLPEIAARLSVSYGRVRVRTMVSRWGSCTARGDLSFHTLLGFLPKEVSYYVVVHELCHRKEMNHTERFWSEVKKLCPDYQKERAVLRKTGSAYIEFFRPARGARTER